MKEIHKYAYGEELSDKVISGNPNNPKYKKYWEKYIKNVQNYTNDPAEYLVKTSYFLSLKYLVFSYEEKLKLSKNIIENLKL